MFLCSKRHEGEKNKKRQDTLRLKWICLPLSPDCQRSGFADQESDGVTLMGIKMEHSQEDKCCVGAEAPGCQRLATTTRHVFSSGSALPAETSMVPPGHHMLHKCVLRLGSSPGWHQHLLCAGWIVLGSHSKEVSRVYIFAHSSASPFLHAPQGVSHFSKTPFAPVYSSKPRPLEQLFFLTRVG